MDKVVIIQRKVNRFLSGPDLKYTGYTEPGLIISADFGYEIVSVYTIKTPVVSVTAAQKGSQP